MRNRINIVLFLLLVIVIFIPHSKTHAQGALKFDNPVYKKYGDSLKQMEYRYALPILGKKAYKKGYDIPFPLGISAVYFTQRQDINITRTMLGINGGALADFSNYISFNPTIATTNAYTVRPDIWILPFLNIYAILGGGTTKTEVSLSSPVSLNTKQHFGADSYGIGLTLTGAIGPVWIALDNNYNWADVEVVVEPIPAYNASLRVGHTLASPYNPQRSLAIWGGVFYQSIQNNTRGSIPLTDVFPNAGSGETISVLRNWAEDLPPGQRIIANQIIDGIERLVEGSDPGNIIIEYLLDKEVAAPFNLIFGAQYQFNKRWILRTELGVFGKRSQFLLNLNYRFMGFKKRY
ncbi:hypothetical protein [Robertkochia solimangrovi]|uniref:hypothetical protein n=1 Tax=Robertkochia solimangrovi TaxID=2213046 RepID=UPI0018EF7ED5|nr:hypothetical protein [Robertkochia solimangrovi]